MSGRSPSPHERKSHRHRPRRSTNQTKRSCYSCLNVTTVPRPRLSLSAEYLPNRYPLCNCPSQNNRARHCSCCFHNLERAGLDQQHLSREQQHGYFSLPFLFRLLSSKTPLLHCSYMLLLYSLLKLPTGRCSDPLPDGRRRCCGWRGETPGALRRWRSRRAGKRCRTTADKS